MATRFLKNVAREQLQERHVFKMFLYIKTAEDHDPIGFDIWYFRIFRLPLLVSKGQHKDAEVMTTFALFEFNQVKHV